jgi:hypothetical protein
VIVCPVSPTFSRKHAGGNQITNASRDLLFDFLASFPSKKFVLLTGDRHAAGLAQFGNVTEVLACPAGVETSPTVNTSDQAIADRWWSNGANTTDPNRFTPLFGIGRLGDDGSLKVEYRRSIDGSTVPTPYGDVNNQIQIW